MADLHHFTYGAITPVLAYLASVIGAATGLSATSRARAAASRRARSAWLLVGAVSIGGTGVWVMHFVAMLGFTVAGMPINYDVPLTILSVLVAVVVVAIGLHLVGFFGDRLPFLIGGGLVAGLGVAGMHYLGMAAMRMSGHMSHSPKVVAAAVGIAVVAATAALWMCVHTRGAVGTTVSALIMGVAVCGMHYTGMAGVTVSGAAGAVPDGATPTSLLGPLIFGVAGMTVLLGFAVIAWPTEAEMRDLAAFDARRGVPAAGAPATGAQQAVEPAAVPAPALAAASAPAAQGPFPVPGDPR